MKVGGDSKLMTIADSCVYLRRKKVGNEFLKSTLFSRPIRKRPNLHLSSDPPQHVSEFGS